MNTQVEQTPLEAPIEPDLGRWKVKRNLHYWVLGIVVTVLTVFMLGEAMKSEHPDDATVAEKNKLKEKQNAALNKTEQAPAREDLEQTLAKQQKEAQERLDALAKAPQATDLPQSAQLPGNLVPMPQGSQSGGPLNLPPLPQGKPRPDAGLPSPESMQAGQSQEMQMAVKREEQVLASPIMAIDNTSKLSLIAGKANKPGGSSTLERASQDLAEEREKRLADSKVDRDQMFNKALNASSSLMGAGAAGQGRAAAGSQQNFYENLASQETGNDVLRPIASRGKFSLMQGASIPSVLITEVRSDLPGDIKASTTMDVYDSVNGAALLIPKGTILVGKYNNEVKVGQEKVMAGFTRMIYPSGASVDLGGMKAAEGSGEGGLSDDVDNHFFKMFGTNFLIAGLAQFFQKDQGGVTVVNNGGGGANQLSNTAGQILADTVRVINERNRSIPPTIYVYRGHKFNVMVNKDMVLPPYQTGVRQ